MKDLGVHIEVNNWVMLIPICNVDGIMYNYSAVLLPGERKGEYEWCMIYDHGIQSHFEDLGVHSIDDLKELLGEN